MRGARFLWVAATGCLTGALACSGAVSGEARAPASTSTAGGRPPAERAGLTSYQRDADRDGQSDAVDACPSLPGLPSRVLVNNGCPPPGYYDDGLAPGDRDGDTVADAVDACADAPGAPSDDLARTGCPKEAPLLASNAAAGPVIGGAPPGAAETCRREATLEAAQAAGCPLAWLDGDRIRFAGSIAFLSGSAGLLLPSETVLDAVARLLRDHPEITRLRVLGHTDGVGPRDVNLKLSQRRADQVVARLASAGVARERLEARGVGLETPVDTNDTAEGRARNRRVELSIERAPEASPASTSLEGAAP